LSEKINQAVEERREIVQGNWSRLVSGEVKKCFSVVKLKVMLSNIWSEVSVSVNRKVVDFIRDKLEREREEIHKRKVKRMRQKWKTLMKKSKLRDTIKKIELTRTKDIWTEAWGNFENRMKRYGEIMQRRIHTYRTETMNKRKTLSEMLIDNAQNLKKLLRKQWKNIT
jgi:hypothetical protein